MEPSSSLLPRLIKDFPNFTFVSGEVFKWSPYENKIYYSTQDFSDAQLLHELAHAALDHREYTQDIELVKIERAAWEHAVTVLAPLYEVIIPTSLVDELMDSYRQWLHDRSLCVNCGHTGVQTKTDIYQCLNCRCQWRANEARMCMLRRYKV